MADGPLIEISDFDWIKNSGSNLLWSRVDPPENGSSGGASASLKSRVKKYEKSIVQSAIDRSSTLQQAADKLQISKQSLNYKIKDLQIHRPTKNNE